MRTGGGEGGVKRGEEGRGGGGPVPSPLVKSPPWSIKFGITFGFPKSYKVRFYTSSSQKRCGVVVRCVVRGVWCVVCGG